MKLLLTNKLVKIIDENKTKNKKSDKYVVGLEDIKGHTTIITTEFDSYEIALKYVEDIEDQLHQSNKFVIFKSSSL